MTNTAAHLTERLRRPAEIRSLTLGETKLSFVPDGVARFTARTWLDTANDQDWAEHAEYLDQDGHLVVSMGGLLVERAGRALLVDAGFGPLELAPPQNPFGTMRGGALLDSLAALGRSPEDIEAVAFTHLHPDHVGWAWHPVPGSDRPAFTGADYLVAEPEWTQRQHAEEMGMGDMLKAMAPRVRTVPDGAEIFPGVLVRFAAGHSAGHTAYVISAGGQRVIAFGDAFHSPVQIGRPDWAVTLDHDRAQSTAVRRTLLAELAEPDTIGYGGHFADVVFGRVHRVGDQPVWRPVDA